MINKENLRNDPLRSKFDSKCGSKTGMKIIWVNQT